MLVLHASLCDNFLHFKYLGVAADACIGFPVIYGDRRHFAELVLATGSVCPEVAHSAVNLVVWALDGAVVVKLALAGDTREALFVVQPLLGIHLFSLEHLHKEEEKKCAIS